jgi:N-acetylneuraminic acid mutarotase
MSRCPLRSPCKSINMKARHLAGVFRHKWPKTRAIAGVLSFLCALLLAGVTSTAHASTWRAAADQPVNATASAATLMADGRLMVSGGSSGGITTSVHAYDWQRNQWDSLPALPRARQNHTSTRLSNGDILVIGGNLVGTDGAAVDRYINASNSWTSVQDLDVAGIPTRIREHTATLLADGRVLLAGGTITVTPSILGTASAATFDAATNSWTAVAGMTTDRRQHTATLLVDGRVFVVGGTSDGAAERFDPTTNTWATVASAAYVRSNHTATRLADGRVLVVGGTGKLITAIGAEAPLDSAEIYDPVANTWTTVGNMTMARSAHRAALLPDGRVLITGSPASPLSAATEIFDPVTSTFSIGSPMLVTRNIGYLAVLPNGEVIVGGASPGATANKVERINLSVAATVSAASMPFTRQSFIATPLANGEVLVTGGNSTGTARYNPTTDVWTTSASLPQPRINHTATLLADGRVLVAGGGTSNPALDRAFVYDPATDTWTETPRMNVARALHTATLMTDGSVLVAGGTSNANITLGNGIASAERYDPYSNRWTPVANMSAARAVHVAALLPDGRVLVATGNAYLPTPTLLATAEAYDPIANTWTSAGSVTNARMFAGVARLPDGRVVVSGGVGLVASVSTAMPDTDVFNPSTLLWTSAGAMAEGRSRPHMASLGNGDVVTIGGEDSVIASLASSEIFDALTLTWRTSVTLPAARRRAAIALLQNGDVLVAGGAAPISSTATALRFRASTAPAVTRVSTVSLSAATIAANTGFAVTGTGYRPTLEGSGGGTTNAAVNFPMLQVRHIASNITRWIAPDTATVTNTSLSTASNAMNGLPAGVYHVTTWVSGVPSIAASLQMLPPFTLRGVASRKTHGALGAIDVAIDSSIGIGGAVTTEPRSSSGNHLVVFYFSGSVSSIGATSVVDAASHVIGSPVITTSGNEVRFALSGIADLSRAALSVNAVNGAVDANAALGFLVGDANNTRAVKASDLASIRYRASGPVTPPTFNPRFDVDVSGVMDAADVNTAKANAGVVLP